MSDDDSQLRQFCGQCGGKNRSDTTFCVYCGSRMDGLSNGQKERHSIPTSPRLNASNNTPLNLGTPQLIALGLGSIFFLIVAYLLLSYSIVVGVLVIGALALLVLWIRKTQGKQTDFEQQMFHKAGHYGRSAQKVYTEANTKYQTWSQEQAAERERNATFRQVEEQRNVRRERLDQYKQFFERAHSGSQSSLDWWKAYDDGDSEEYVNVSELLQSARDRAQVGFEYVRDYKQEFEEILQDDRFDEAEQVLAEYRQGQENLEGNDSVFPPLVEVHEKIKRSDYWANYRSQLEHFIKQLEDLLGSPNVRTAPANRVRFPDPSSMGFAGTSAMHVSQPHESSIVEGNVNEVGGSYSSRPSPSAGVSPQAYLDMVIAYMVSDGFSVDNRSDTSVTFVRNGEEVDGASCIIIAILLLLGIVPGLIYLFYINSRRVHTNLVAISTPDGIRPIISGNDKGGCSKLQSWTGVERVR